MLLDVPSVEEQYLLEQITGQPCYYQKKSPWFCAMSCYLQTDLTHQDQMNPHSAPTVTVIRLTTTHQVRGIRLKLQ